MKTNAKNHAINYGAGYALGEGVVALLERWTQTPLEGREATLVILAVVFVTHRLRPLADALLRRAVAWAKTGAPMLLVALIPTLTGCATTDCNEIYARARAWRAVAIATGAGGVAGGLSTIPLEEERAEIALAASAAGVTALSVAAGFVADSYADEHAGYCGPVQTSTGGG